MKAWVRKIKRMHTEEFTEMKEIWGLFKVNEFTFKIEIITNE